MPILGEWRMELLLLHGWRMENSRRRFHRMPLVSHPGSLLSPQAHRAWSAGIHSYHMRATKGCHTFLHGEVVLLAPLFSHSPFSENPFSILREGLTTPSVKWEGDIRMISFFLEGLSPKWPLCQVLSRFIFGLTLQIAGKEWHIECGECVENFSHV